jgi:hypothetical protein
MAGVVVVIPIGLGFMIVLGQTWIEMDADRALYTQGCAAICYITE